MALDYNADDEEIDERNAKRRTRDILTRDEGIEPGPNPISRKLASFWKEQIEEVEKEDAKWIRVGNQIIKRFRDERNKAQAATERRMNLLWANFKILKPALYGKKPIPIVERKFLDRDPTGRLSAMMLERALRNELDRKSTRLNSSHVKISYAVFCL